jgi:hypothetical protein
MAAETASFLDAASIGLAHLVGWIEHELAWISGLAEEVRRD